MVEFTPADGEALLAEGHGHDEVDLRTGMATLLGEDRNATKAQVHADLADYSEAWYSEEHGFGHDCAAHQDVDKSLWSPGCHAGGFRPVTIAVGIPATGTVQRAAKTEAT